MICVCGEVQLHHAALHVFTKYAGTKKEVDGLNVLIEHSSQPPIHTDVRLRALLIARHHECGVT